MMFDILSNEYDPNTNFLSEENINDERYQRLIILQNGWNVG